MKKIVNIILCASAVAALTSCEKFFTREPINEFSSETYFSSESELKMYADGMLNSWLPDYTETSSGDAYNDLIATKTSTDYYRADVIWDDSKQSGWSWTFARRINYMIEGMEKNAKGVVADDIYNHYMGVARFWRAYQYFSMVKTFSNVPWLDHVIQPDEDDILYGDREDREYVFHNMVEDMKFATANVMAGKFHGTSGDTRNQIDKYVVNAFASRFYLYEATYRVNHKVNPATGQPWNNNYESPKDLLELAAAAAKEVIDEGGFSLHSTYADLFISNTLCADEVIWGQVFDANVNGRHALTRYFNSSTMGQQYSGTKFLVRNFLKNDGTPVTTDEISFVDEFKDRDLRLSATVLGPDRRVTNLNGESVVPSINCTFCKTGYMLVKWCIPDETHYQNSVDENSIPIIRYAEVLLNYAEAMNELGKFDKSVWDLTVGALRTRAGVTSIYPTKADEYLNNYYTVDSNNTHITDGDLAVALEIRRERVTELTFEAGLRQNDMYRWGQADLIERRYNHQGWPGIWVSEDEAKNGFTFAGKTYTFGDNKTSNSETNYPISNTENLNWTLEKDGKGYLLVYNYKLQWDDNKMYVRPIPAEAKNVNPNLTESYGW